MARNSSRRVVDGKLHLLCTEYWTQTGNAVSLVCCAGTFCCLCNRVIFTLHLMAASFSVGLDHPTDHTTHLVRALVNC